MSLLRTYSIVTLMIGSLSSSCREDATEVSHSIIDGTWETACVTEEDQTSQSVRYVFLANNSAQRTAKFYSDENCQVLSAELMHEGVFGLAVRQSDSLYEIDMNFRRAIGQPKTEEGARLWNTQLFCGISRWLLLQYEEVQAQTDERCGVYGTSLIEYRDVISLDANNVLTFGTQLNQARPRPETVDGQNPRNVFLFKSE